mmetsp:Transcript_146391/g.469702  ORF Transcript_146391/g.469702 Transcript_146391/m.469702 type:complete len:208 (-) Transcript_146391:1032-1655(-)
MYDPCGVSHRPASTSSRGCVEHLAWWPPCQIFAMRSDNACHLPPRRTASLSALIHARSERYFSRHHARAFTSSPSPRNTKFCPMPPSASRRRADSVISSSEDVSSTSKLTFLRGNTRPPPACDDRRIAISGPLPASSSTTACSRSHSSGVIVIETKERCFCGTRSTATPPLVRRRSVAAKQEARPCGPHNSPFEANAAACSDHWVPQ